MILVIARAKTKAGAEAQFVEAAGACVEMTRKESGNISYTLLEDCAQRGAFTFLEQWASQGDLDAHMKTAHFIAFGAAIDGLLAEDLSIDVFEASKA